MDMMSKNNLNPARALVASIPLLLATMLGCVTPETDEPVEIPPENALPLSEIVALVESMGYTTIVEAEFEDGAWEIEYVSQDEERKILVDPVTGEVLTILPDESPEESDSGPSG